MAVCLPLPPRSVQLHRLHGQFNVKSSRRCVLLSSVEGALPPVPTASITEENVPTWTEKRLQTYNDIAVEPARLLVRSAHLPCFGEIRHQSTALVATGLPFGSTCVYLNEPASHQHDQNRRGMLATGELALLPTKHPDRERERA